MRFLNSLFNKKIDKWLDLYGMSLERRIMYCSGMTDAFAEEFDPKLRPQLDKKYRDAKSDIAYFMRDKAYDDLFATWYEEIEHLPLHKDNMTSYIHISMNRYFAAEQRLMEYMAYLFCWKYYLTRKHLDNR